MGRTFSGFWGSENQVCRDLSHIKFKKCVSLFQDDQIKRLYKVDP